MLKKIFQDDSTVMDKFNHFLEKKRLESDPLVRFCIRPGCDGYVMAKGFNVKKVECPKCAQQICFKCREEYHGYFTSCEKFLEKKFSEWSKNNLAISFCPKCKTKVEKVSGCNHMTCYLCKFQWCWICGGTYTKDHYNPLIPFTGCGN